MWHMNKFKSSLVGCCSLLLLLLTTIISSTAAQTCPPTNFDSITNFDFDSFIKDRWYALKQIPSLVQPLTQFYCVAAKYTLITKKSLWCTIFGCTDPPSITVFNSARKRSVTGKVNSITFEATITDASASKSKLAISSRIIPRPLRRGSNYWVVAGGKWNVLSNVTDPPISNYTYDWAIISAGLPENVGTDGKCFSNTGLWMFSKLNVPPTNAINAIEVVATGLGLSTSQWKLVTQEGCQY